LLHNFVSSGQKQFDISRGEKLSWFSCNYKPFLFSLAVLCWFSPLPHTTEGVAADARRLRRNRTTRRGHAMPGLIRCSGSAGSMPLLFPVTVYLCILSSWAAFFTPHASMMPTNSGATAPNHEEKCFLFNQLSARLLSAPVLPNKNPNRIQDTNIAHGRIVSVNHQQNFLGSNEGLRKYIL